MKLIEDIDANNTNITEEEGKRILDAINTITYKEERLSKYAACSYLRISRASFDNYVREGKIPRGKHTLGFKELSWDKKDLDKFISTCNK